MEKPILARKLANSIFRGAAANDKMVAALPPSSLPAYRLTAAVEPFYAGGALTLLPDGRVACACGDEVKVKEEGGAAACRRFSFPFLSLKTHSPPPPLPPSRFQIVCLETGAVELTLAGVSWRWRGVERRAACTGEPAHAADG